MGKYDKHRNKSKDGKLIFDRITEVRNDWLAKDDDNLLTYFIQRRLLYEHPMHAHSK